MVWHDPLLPGGEVRPRGLQGHSQNVPLSFPDLHRKVEDQIVEEDKKVTRFTIRATHKGDLMGISATGKTIRVTGISIIIFNGGKVV